MTKQTKIEEYKETHKDILRNFAQSESQRDMYIDYILADRKRHARCFGDLFGNYLTKVNKQEYSEILFPLKFNRRLGYFDYNSLFEELNTIYGYYFKIRRYYSGYRFTRLVELMPIKSDMIKSLHWAGLYTAFLLLRKININYLNDWENYFRTNRHKKPIKTWKDIITISETAFGDDTYHLHNELFRLCYIPDYNGINRWTERYLEMLTDIFGKGIKGDGNKLRISETTHNTRMIDGLFLYLESAK